MTSAPERPGRWRAALAACVAGMVAVTWARVALAGTLRVDQVALPVRWAALLVACWILLASGAALAYGRGLSASGAEPLERLLLPAVALHALAALALPYSSNDVFSYLAYGRMIARGLSPYASGPAALPPGDPFRAMVGAAWLDSPSVYGPVLNAFGAVAARAGSLAVAVVSFKALMLGAIVGALVAIHAACRRLGAEASARFAFFAFNPLLLHEVSGQAHNEAVVLLLVAAFVWAALAGREVTAAAAGALAVGAKATAAPVLALYLLQLLRTAPRAAVRAGAVSAALLAFVAFGPWTPAHAIRGVIPAWVIDPALVSRSYAFVLSHAAEALGGAHARVIAYRACTAMGLALLAVVGARAARRSRDLQSALEQALAFLLVYYVAGATWMQPWYLSSLVALAVVAPARWRRLVAAFTAQYVVAWFPDLGALEAVVVQTAVLVTALRWTASPGDAPVPSRAA